MGVITSGWDPNGIIREAVPSAVVEITPLVLLEDHMFQAKGRKEKEPVRGFSAAETTSIQYRHCPPFLPFTISLSCSHHLHSSL